MAFPHLVTVEGLEPHTVRRLYLFWSDKPSAIVDTSETVDTKVEALRAHASQLREPDELERRVREWAARTGSAAGLAAAESFRIIDLER